MSPTANPPTATPSHAVAPYPGPDPSALVPGVTPAQVPSRGPETGSEPILQVHGLVKRYGSVPALDGLDLTVHRGEVYGFLGRNGAGKSTTIRILMGITKASSGSLRLFGRDAGRGAVKLRHRIGYVAQEQNFYGWMTPLTLGRFLRGFYPTWDPGHYDALVRNLELPPRRKIRTFSGGMKVKLALAAALAHRPEVLILDEPTAGLDPVARREFLEMVRDQAERSGRTTFFSTHLIDEVEMAAHRVGIIDHGRARYEGTIEELVSQVRRLTHRPAPAASGDESAAELPPALLDPQAGFRILQDYHHGGERPVRQVVVQAQDPARFGELVPPSQPESWGQPRPDPAHGWALEELPLEEIFIEMVRRPLGPER